MYCKCHFLNEKAQITNENDRFKTKSAWSPPKGHTALQLFLSNTEKDLFYLLPGKAGRYNLNRDEWKGMRHLAKDRSIIIKPADKGSCVVVCDHLAEAEN